MPARNTPERPPSIYAHYALMSTPPTLQIIETILGAKPRALILKGAVSGAIACADVFSHLPLLSEARKRRIPVFVIRDGHNTANLPVEQRRANPLPDYENVVVPVRHGAIYLQRADAATEAEVFEHIQTARRQHRRTRDFVRAVCERYNTPEYNAQLEKIRGRPLW